MLDPRIQSQLSWSVNNPTPGTGIATIAAQATLADTSPFVQINAGALPVQLDYLKLTCTNIGSGATSVRFAAQSYAIQKAAPTPSSALQTLVNGRSDWTLQPATTVWCGALVAAAGTPVLQHSTLLRPAAPAVGDVYLVKFDEAVASIQEALTPSGSSILSAVIGAPGIAVMPNTTTQLHLFLPGQSQASSWEIELTLREIRNWNTNQ